MGAISGLYNGGVERYEPEWKMELYRIGPKIDT
jgi:hypothetical protein